MKKYFLTGIATLLPIVITAALTLFLINLFTKPFLGGVHALLNMLDLSAGLKTFLLMISRLIVLVILFFVIIFVGYMTRWYVIHGLIRLSDKILHRIPLVNKVYKASQEVVDTLFSGKKTSFKQVVSVPFPHEGGRSIGLVTHDPSEEGSQLISVFVPAIPNPTMGFLLLFRPEQITPLDMTVEEAFKGIVSCGIMFPHGELKRKIEERDG